MIPHHVHSWDMDIVIVAVPEWVGVLTMYAPDRAFGARYQWRFCYGCRFVQ